MFRFFPAKETENNEELTFDDQGAIPQHIAIIMDGNGRWAKKRFLPRVAGHKEGMKNIRRIAIAANDLGVKAITLYAFSTENWKRPDEEVSFLMKLPLEFFDSYMPELMENNIRVMHTGYMEHIPEKTRRVIEWAIDKTKNNTGLVLNFALNYGSRAEIISATRAIAHKVQSKELAIEDITEDTMAEHLMTAQLGLDLQDPDLMIRTSGEERISNFLLWQIAYSEFYFTDELWPDFNEESLYRAIASYQTRHRRFGGLETEEEEK